MHWMENSILQYSTSFVTVLASSRNVDAFWPLFGILPPRASARVRSEQAVDELDWFNGDLRWRSSAAAMPGRGPALLFLEASQRRAAASHQAHYANPRFDF